MLLVNNITYIAIRQINKYNTSKVCMSINYIEFSPFYLWEYFAGNGAYLLLQFH